MDLSMLCVQIILHVSEKSQLCLCSNLAAHVTRCGSNKSETARQCYELLFTYFVIQNLSKFEKIRLRCRQRLS